MPSGKQARTRNSLGLISHVCLPECISWFNSIILLPHPLNYELFLCAQNWCVWDTQRQLPISSLDLSFPKYETGLVIVICIIQGASKHDILTKFEMTLKLPSILQPKGFVVLISVVLIINCLADSLMLHKCTRGYFCYHHW